MFKFVKAANGIMSIPGQDNTTVLDVETEQAAWLALANEHWRGHAHRLPGCTGVKVEVRHRYLEVPDPAGGPCLVSVPLGVDPTVMLCPCGEWVLEDSK